MFAYHLHVLDVQDMRFLLPIELEGRKEAIARALEQNSAGKSFNEIEIPGSESLTEYVGRIASFFKVGKKH